EIEQLQADYEKTYKKYETITLPKITDAKYIIDIYPESRDIKALIGLRLKNKSTEPIDSLHFTIERKWNQKIHIRNAELVLNDEKLDYLIYKLNKPLMPNESMNLVVESSYITNGFENEVSDLIIA